MSSENIMKDFILVVDNHYGVYSAQTFAERFPFEQIDGEGVTKEDWDILLAGPDHDDYVETWADLFDGRFVVIIDGKRYRVYENDDIWLYPAELQDEIDWDELAK